MKRSSLFLAFALLGLASFAQNWQLIDPERTYLFGDLNQAIRVDSVEETGNARVYHNYEQVRFCDDNLFAPFPIRLTRWLSQPIRHDTLRGQYTLLNAEGDSIYWETRSQPGESWLFCAPGDSLWIWATHDSTTSDWVWGQVDSVKWYHLERRTLAGQVVANDSINGLILKLSKHFGPLSMFNPDGFPGDFSIDLLQGVSHPAAGVQMLSEDEIWEVPVGLELHFREEESSDHWYPSNGGVIAYEHMIRWKVLDKSGVSGQDTLTIDRTRAGSNEVYVYDPDSALNNYRETQLVFQRDTFVFARSYDPTGEAILPYQRVLNSRFISGIFRVRGIGPDSQVLGQRAVWDGIYTDAHFPTSDSCLTPIIDSYQSFLWVEGLGRSFEWSMNMGGSFSQRPVYYHNALDTAGTPINFDSLYQVFTVSQATPVEPQLRLFPNPNRGRFTLQSETAPLERVQLYDLTGREVPFSTEKAGDQWHLHTAHRGWLLLRIYTRGGVGVKRVRVE